MVRRFWASESGRKVIRDVGEIVLGVLIALALGAVATEIGWQVETAHARRGLSSEIGELVGQAEERRGLAPCVDRRLDRIAELIDRAAANGELPPVGDIGNPPYRTWTRGVWDSNVSAQTAAHLDRDELDNYSALYEYVMQLNHANLRELEIWTTLYGVVGPGRRIDAAEVATFRAAIREARFQNRFITLLGVRMRQVADAYGLRYDREDVVEHRGKPEKLAICQPVTTDPPAAYGQAPLSGAIEKAIAEPIGRR